MLRVVVKRVLATMHHYGWVKPPRAMQGKIASFNKYWHDDAWMKAHIPDVEEYAHDGKEPLRRFEGTHPAAMRRRIAAMNWKVRIDPAEAPLRTKDRLKLAVEAITGWRPGEYKNFRLG